MKTDGGRLEQVYQHGREQMLAGVLLHMVEASIAVDPPGDLGFGQRTSEKMRNTVPIINHLHHLETAQFPSIERLAAGSWIEGGAVQIYAPPVRTHLHHPSPEIR